LREGKLIHLITRILKLGAANILLLDEPLNHLSFRNSRILNDIIEEVKAVRPELTILMISHCKAISFVDKIMRYDYDIEKIVTKKYKSYSCFATIDSSVENMSFSLHLKDNDNQKRINENCETNSAMHPQIQNQKSCCILDSR
jgi:ATPase subunit of ABC transporter with duplicated ATPase domains